MRRTALIVTAALLLVPAVAEAQVRLLAGAGLANPLSDLNGAVDVGWHVMGGAQLSIATFPVALRADGGYDSFGEEGTNPQTSILSGALSVVATLPGVGLRPYLLGGMGIYRTSLDVTGGSPTSDTGIHGAFGVDIGAMGFGGFAEVRFVSVKTEATSNMRFVTATLGLRL